MSKDYSNNNSKMGRKTGDLISIIFLSLVSLLSLTFCIGLLLANADLRRQADASRSELDAIEKEGYFTTFQTEQMVESAENTGRTEAMEEIRNTFRDVLDNNGSLSAIRELFPDEMIIAADGEYRFYPIDGELQKNNFSSGDFKANEDGLLEYRGTDKNVKTKNGVVISRYQGEVDFEKIKNSGIDFVMIRVGLRGTADGNILADDYYETNIEAAEEAGLDIGVYFESAATNAEEAKEEAEFIVEQLSERELKYPVALMIEESENTDRISVPLTKENYGEIIDNFCETVEEAGYKSMIYGNIISFTELIDKSELSKRHIFVYFVGEKPYYPYKFDLWEYSVQGHVDGIDGNANLIMSVTDY